MGSGPKYCALLERDRRRMRRRTLLLAGLQNGVTAVIGGRMYQLQVGGTKTYRHLAEENWSNLSLVVLFVSFALYDNPRSAVSVEHGRGGSRVATPIARDIALYWLHGGLPPRRFTRPRRGSKSRRTSGL